MLCNREHNTEKSHVRVGPYFATLPSNVSNKGFKYLHTKKYVCEKSFTESEFPVLNSLSIIVLKKCLSALITGQLLLKREYI